MQHAAAAAAAAAAAVAVQALAFVTAATVFLWVQDPQPTSSMRSSQDSTALRTCQVRVGTLNRNQSQNEGCNFRFSVFILQMAVYVQSAGVYLYNNEL